MDENIFSIDAVGMTKVHSIVVPGLKEYPQSIKDECDKCFNEGISKGKLLFDGGVYAVIDVSLVNRTRNGAVEIELSSEDALSGRCASLGVTITLQRTSYKYFYGTNVCHPELGVARCANILAMCGIVQTSDGFVPLGLRSEKLGEFPNHYHVFGGQVSVFDDDEDVVDRTMYKELEEELLLRKEELVSAHFFGMGRNHLLAEKPEMFFCAVTTLNKEELRERWKRAPDKSEHSRITFVRVDAVDEFMRTNKTSPIGKACLTAYRIFLQGQG